MDALTSIHRLRGVLRANAAFSAAGGLLAVVGFALIDDLVGANGALVAATGAGLISFAVAVLAVASLEPRRMLRGTALVSVADTVWAIATVVVVTTVDLGATGVAVLTAIALVVAGFALAQVRLGSNAHNIDDLDAPVAEEIRVQHHVAAPASAMWPLITNHELYGRLAPNLSRVEVTGGEGEGMRRRCHDTRGRGWNETCTLWDDGHEFAVEVDTSDYPHPLTHMRGRWAVDPDNEDSLITMHFEFTPRPGIPGGVFAALMLLAFRPILRRIIRGWEREVASPGAAKLQAER